MVSCWSPLLRQQHRNFSGFLAAPYTNLFAKSPFSFVNMDLYILSDQNLKVKPGDSGSHLSYMGITPIAAISTLDDDDVSGGVSRRIALPQNNQKIKSTRENKSKAQEKNLPPKNINIF